MMKRNTILMAGLLVLGLLASCKKDDNNQDLTGTDLMRANIEQPTGNGSRTHIEVNGSEGYVRWNEGDQFLVVDANGDDYTFTLNSGQSGETEPMFRSPGSDNMTSPFAAVYPATNSISGTTATITLPATQAYAEGSFANGTNVMVGYQNGSDREVDFKNVLGGLCFPLVGDNVTVTSLVLTSANADDHLSGTFTVDCTSNTPELTYVSDGGNTITIDCGSGVTLSSTPTLFYVMLPAGIMEGGFTVKAYNNGTEILSESTSRNPNISRSVIQKLDGNLQIVTSSLNVTTLSPTFITMNSAKTGGTIVVADGVTLNACGICYSPNNSMPTIGGSGVNTLTASTASTSFEFDLTGLQKDQIYYVCAWAEDNNQNVSYGDPIPFATRKDYANDYGGRIPFPFSLAPGVQVNFSMGNLQYLGTGDDGTENPIWRFADYQYEYMADGDHIGEPEGSYMPSFANYSPSNYNSHSNNIAEQMISARDVFCWGTSGWNSGAVSYQPYSITNKDSDYYPGGVYTNNLTGDYAQADWGVFNPIDNGGNLSGIWRVLIGGEGGEWDYLLNGRTSETYRFTQIAITPLRTLPYPHYGLALFPDGFEWPSYVRQLSEINVSDPISDDPVGAFVTGDFSSFSSIFITEAEWSLLEQLGVVFLPATGYANYAGYIWAGMEGGYYSSTYHDEDHAYALEINIFIGLNTAGSYSRRVANPVRLVCPAQ